jgi:hypothetical protein
LQPFFLRHQQIKTGGVLNVTLEGSVFSFFLVARVPHIWKYQAIINIESSMSPADVNSVSGYAALRK